MEIDLILTYTSSSVVFLPLIIGIIRHRYLTKELQMLFLYVIAAIILRFFVLHGQKYYTIPIILY
ncbi:hypothetical protein J2Y60_001189 [Arcicella sp. BE140]|nr:hypothetical protein [Arcicella sp. BE51]MDR6811004.1 hypothetical protein [Arcicella sp. BE140]MDR6822354.1 hypothetical protein [Arcicella sp. BE139]